MPSTPALGEPFVLHLGHLIGAVPCRASAPVPLREGERAATCVIPQRRTRVCRGDQQAHGLPATVHAWRVSGIVHAHGGASARVEAMTADHGRTPEGEVVAYFTELRGHAADAVQRMAPSVHAATAMRAHQAALQALAPTLF